MTDNTNPFAGLELATDKPTRMPIVHPQTFEVLKDEAGIEAFIPFWSADSEIGRKIDREQQLAGMGRRQVKKSDIIDRNDENELEKLVALTAGDWHLVDLSGRHIDLPFTPANARQLYSNPLIPWLRDQAQMWVRDRANFLPSKPSISLVTPKLDSDLI